MFEPRVVRAGRGWLRLDATGSPEGPSSRLARRIRRIPGVSRVDASDRTARLLIRFDADAVSAASVLAALAVLPPDTEGEEEPDVPATERPPVLVTRRGPVTRARIAVRGLERDASLARTVVKRLGALPGVRAVSASALTGRVLVEFAEADIRLIDLVEEVGLVELPALPGEERPAHPLEREPLIESGGRLVGASLGLGLLAIRNMRGATGPPATRGAAEAAALIGVLEGFPRLRNGVQAVLGPRGADVAFTAATIGALTLSGSTLGLAVSGIGALRAFTEVRERQRAWRRYERRVEFFPAALPGSNIRIEGGDRVPYAGEIVEGAGTGIDSSGTLVPALPGSRVEAGTRLAGGTFVVAVDADPPFEPSMPEALVADSELGWYLEAVPWLALAYAGLTFAVTRSLGRAFIAFVVVNPRAALAAAESADLGASARILRAGVTVAGVRLRPVRRPDVVLVDGARPLVDGYAVEAVQPTDGRGPKELLALAGQIATASASPWPRVFPPARTEHVQEAQWTGTEARAKIGGVFYSLGGGDDPLRLELRAGDELLGEFRLRPRTPPGLADLTACCERFGVELRFCGDARTVRLVRSIGLAADAHGDLVAAVRRYRNEGRRVALVSDSPHAAPAFAEADLAIALASGRSGRFTAQVDVLAPDLGAVAAIVDAGARRDRAVRDGAGIALVANLAGATWVLRRRPTLQRSAYPLYLAALAGFGVAWLRLRGGERPLSLATIADPRPERWGRVDRDEVLRAFDSSHGGLDEHDAALRRRDELRPAERSHRTAAAVGGQLRSPLTALLGVGAALSYAVGARADVGVIAAVVLVNCLVGAWQESEASAATETLERRTTSTARLRRGGQIVTASAETVVPGDLLVLAPGDRIVADARLIEAQGLEVDESSLTGESLPVVKQADGESADSNVVLAGSDVTVGTGEAVVVAVGADTRIGATAAALELAGERRGGLDERLSRMLQQALPVSLAGGAAVVLGSLLWRRPLKPQLAIAAGIAIAALPEGLPLLAGVAEAAVARRLARRNALVRRLESVEALGRVDVACVDKTGTLTEGRLTVAVVADVETEGAVDATLAARLRRVLLAAALASPHPDATEAQSHPTDRAILDAAEVAGLGRRIRTPRRDETQFEPARGFHASVADERLYVKGAPEILLPRLARWQQADDHIEVDGRSRRELERRAQGLAERGLRVLLVATGPAGHGREQEPLTGLGFVGIADPLRQEVRGAVDRCREAGVRVIMITGDHPATALAIGREAGLAQRSEQVIVGDVDAEAFDELLPNASVIARVTPLDKVRIIEQLQQRGHVVAMTGDGVNDAPALRLADVGVAMGLSGTDVAREAADVVLTDDNFATLVEALVEGRGFWQNMRRALGLLLGGNLGEIGLIVVSTLLGRGSPLTARQILAVNLVTDVLPAVAVAVQAPEHRDLSNLAREGLAALDEPLRRDVLRRGWATAVPSLAASLAIGARSSVPQAQTAAFGSVVATQLAQTWELGRSETELTRPVAGAVAGSAFLMIATTAVAPLRRFLGIAIPSPATAAAITLSALAAPRLARWTFLAPSTAGELAVRAESVTG